MSIAVQQPKEDRRAFLRRLKSVVALVGAGGALSALGGYARTVEPLRSEPDFLEFNELASDPNNPGSGKGRMYAKVLPGYGHNIPFFRDEGGYIQQVIGSDGHIIIASDSYESIPQGGWRWGMDTNHVWGGHWGNFNSHNDGDNIIYRVWIAKGSYHIHLLCTRAANRGICDIDFDGTEKASFDLYTSGTYHRTVFKATYKDVDENGLVDLRVRVDGKNASSSDHYVTWDTLSLWRGI